MLSQEDAGSDKWKIGDPIEWKEGGVVDTIKKVIDKTKGAVSDKMIENAQKKMDKMEKRVNWMMQQNTKMQGVVKTASQKLIDAKNEMDALPASE